MNIHPVRSAKDLRTFINLPYDLYRDDPNWVPPLRGEQTRLFKPSTNPFLHHCDWQLFLLKEGSRPVGRIAAFVDEIAMDFWQKPIGLFGYFECIQNEAASKQLLEAAMIWLKEHQCSHMRGPWSFVTQEFGMVLEGYEPPPVIMAPYNPPYYNDYLQNFGLQKAKDLLCWQISIPQGYRIPERILSLTDAVAKRYGVRTRHLDMQRFDDEVQTFLELSNSSIIQNWGYTPVTDLEAEAMARDLKQVLQSKAAIFAEDKEGHPIGFALAIPDVNFILRNMHGRLLPFGFIKLLRGIPRLQQYRMFALGVIPKFQGKAVDSLLYRALHESLHSDQLQMEINYVLEDNRPMINAIEKLGATPLRRYRLYEGEIR